MHIKTTYLRTRIILWNNTLNLKNAFSGFSWVVIFILSDYFSMYTYIYFLGMLSTGSMPSSHCPTASDHSLSTLPTIPFWPTNPNHHRKWFNFYKHRKWAVPRWIKPHIWPGKINQLISLWNWNNTLKLFSHHFIATHIKFSSKYWGICVLLMAFKNFFYFLSEDKSNSCLLMHEIYEGSYKLRN